MLVLRVESEKDGHLVVGALQLVPLCAAGRGTNVALGQVVQPVQLATSVLFVVEGFKALHALFELLGNGEW